MTPGKRKPGFNRKTEKPEKRKREMVWNLFPEKTILSGKT